MFDIFLNSLLKSEFQQQAASANPAASATTAAAATTATTAATTTATGQPDYSGQNPICIFRPHLRISDDF